MVKPADPGLAGKWTLKHCVFLWLLFCFCLLSLCFEFHFSNTEQVQMFAKTRICNVLSVK